MQSYSKDGIKPRAAVEREIDIYRETLKIVKPFTPDDLEDMSLLRKVQSAANDECGAREMCSEEAKTMTRKLCSST